MRLTRVNRNYLIGCIIATVLIIVCAIIGVSRYVEHNRVIAQQAALDAEIFQKYPGIGQRPIMDTQGYPSIREYLRTTLNDYESSEVLAMNAATPQAMNNINVWIVTARIRAKNGFGAKIIKDYRFYIHDETVLLMQDTDK